MIDPRDFLSAGSSTDVEEIEEVEGTFSCPENGCYEMTYEGLMNPNTRVVTWICSNGHQGKATI